MITITPKRATFSGTHSLLCFGPGHPCARKHGHTWWVQATFTGEPDDDGILIDYDVVRQVVKPLSVDLDPMFDGKASGENILAWLVAEFLQRCAGRPSCQLARVELTEDPVPGDAHTLVWTP